VVNLIIKLFLFKDIIVLNFLHYFLFHQFNLPNFHWLKFVFLFHTQMTYSILKMVCCKLMPLDSINGYEVFNWRIMFLFVINNIIS